MKEEELRRHAICSICSGKIMSDGSPIFWTVKIERHGIDVKSIQRQAGLEMMLGNVAIAQVMGLDEELTKSLLGPVDITLCEGCALRNKIVVKAFEKAEGE